MRVIVAMGLLVGALGLSPAGSHAAFITGCCACLPDHTAVGASAGRLPTEALFCQLIVGEGFPPFATACTQAGGVPTTDCPEPTDGPASCAALLAEQNILCPANAAGAPTASTAGLAGLAALLGLGGVMLLRRRRA